MYTIVTGAELVSSNPDLAAVYRASFRPDELVAKIDSDLDVEAFTEYVFDHVSRVGRSPPARWIVAEVPAGSKYFGFQLLGRVGDTSIVIRSA